MSDAGSDRPRGGPARGGLAAEALRRGKQLRRRRIFVRRGATTLALASAVAVGIALRVGGTPSPAVRPIGPATTRSTVTAPPTTPTTTATTPPPTTTPTTTRTTQPTTTAPAAPGPCQAAQLSGTFAAVPGGRSAGHIVYLLQLQNTSSSPCVLQGPPGMLLLGTGGTPLPTHTSVQSGGAAMTLAPGKSAYSAVQFSPDVPGPGEPTSGQCEPTAESVDVSLPGMAGSVAAALAPPSPVCEQGQLDMTALSTTYPTNL
jgi:hypothetical protein